MPLLYVFSNRWIAPLAFSVSELATIDYIPKVNLSTDQAMRFSVDLLAIYEAFYRPFIIIVL